MAPTTTPSKSFKKRLIVCCDGTWQSSNHGIQSIPSNIAKISRAIAKYTTDDKGNIVHQVVFYDAGVGTATDSVVSKMAAWAKKHQGAYGEGLDENVCEAYNFLVNNYNPGDEIFFFGFSRGAYTARATSGLVARVGLCSNAMMDDFYAMYKAYKGKKAHQPIAETEWGTSDAGKKWLEGCDKTFSIEVVGVFDTVGALGWPNNTHVDVNDANKPHAFHNTAVHPEIKNAFQALALDEHRAAFPPNLWSLHAPKGNKPPTNLIQCWFPGYHINVGGGSDDLLKKAEEQKGDFESMANITFAWMVDRVQQFTDLGFDDAAIYNIIERYAQNVTSLIERFNPSTGNKHNQVYQGWGIGPNADSMDTLQAVAGSEPRTPAEYHLKEEEENQTPTPKVDAKTAEEYEKITNEYIHPVVAFANDPSTDTKWPEVNKSLDGFKREPAPNGIGHVWTKTYIVPPPESEWKVVKAASSVFSYGKSFFVTPPPPAGTPRTLTIPEFIIPQDSIVEDPVTGKDTYTAPWGLPAERHLIRADTSRYAHDDQRVLDDEAIRERVKVVKRTFDFIQRLDKENGFKDVQRMRAFTKSTLEGNPMEGATLMPKGAGVEEKVLKAELGEILVEQVEARMAAESEKV